MSKRDSRQSAGGRWISRERQALNPEAVMLPEPPPVTDCAPMVESLNARSLSAVASFYGVSVLEMVKRFSSK
jgi:hypothetical protein